MESHKIKELLEKYFEATATVAEEEQLRSYFLGKEVAPEFEEYISMFQYFSIAKDEKFTKQVPLKPRKRNYKWLSVAAVVLLTCGIYFGKQYQEKQQALFAYNETKKAFNLIAKHMNKGTAKLSYLGKFEESKNKIYKHN